MTYIAGGEKKRNQTQTDLEVAGVARALMATGLAFMVLTLQSLAADAVASRTGTVTAPLVASVTTAIAEFLAFHITCQHFRT